MYLREDTQYSKGLENLLEQGNYSRNRGHFGGLFLFYRNMGWRILYIENAKSMRLYLDNIKIERETGDLIILYLI